MKVTLYLSEETILDGGPFWQDSVTKIEGDKLWLEGGEDGDRRMTTRAGAVADAISTEAALGEPFRAGHVDEPAHISPENVCEIEVEIPDDAHFDGYDLEV